MKYPTKFIILSALAWVLNVPTALAMSNFFEFNKAELHCGKRPDINLYEGIVAALAGSDRKASELSLRPDSDEFKLELILHFHEQDTAIPDDCKPKLLTLSQLAKEKKIGDILVRSSTGAEGSSEMDLAVAGERLEKLKQFFREDRLARRALILELHPLPSSRLLEKTLAEPQIVEIYSSPLK